MRIDRFQLRVAVSVQCLLVARVSEDSAHVSIVELGFRRTAGTACHLAKFMNADWFHLVIAGPPHEVVDDGGSRGRVKAIGERRRADDVVNPSGREEFLYVISNAGRKGSMMPCHAV